MSKQLSIVFLFCIAFFLIPITSQVSAQSNSSQCVVTKVGTPNTSPTLPANCSSGGDGKVVYYCQQDPKWNGDNYPEFGSGNECILNAGCGPTSLAMIMSTFGVKMTPVDVDRIFQKNGWRSGCDGGSSYGLAVTSSWFQQTEGFTVGPNVAEGGKPDLTLMKQYTDQGYLIYNGVDNYPCLGCTNPGLPVGHVFVIDNVDLTTKRIHVRDPNNCDPPTGKEKTNQNWVMVEPDSKMGDNTFADNSSGYTFDGGYYSATWNGSFPIKKGK